MNQKGHHLGNSIRHVLLDHDWVQPERILDGVSNEACLGSGRNCTR